MEKWLFGGPDVAGEAYRQFVKEFIQENKLVKGDLVLGGEKVDLKNLSMPVLNVYAERDHLVPPPSTVALSATTSATSRTIRSCRSRPAISASTPAAPRKILAPGVAKWLKEH